MVADGRQLFLNLCLTFAGFSLLGGLTVLVDGEVFQGFDSLTNISVNLNGSVAVSRPENNSFLVTFPSGISVTVTEVQESLSIVFAAPVSFKGYTKGLLGTWNDDPLDDFLRPDGTTLAHNATGREIHSFFGQKCKLLDCFFGSFEVLFSHQNTGCSFFFFSVH